MYLDVTIGGNTARLVADAGLSALLLQAVAADGPVTVRLAAASPFTGRLLALTGTLSQEEAPRRRYRRGEAVA